MLPTNSIRNGSKNDSDDDGGNGSNVYLMPVRNTTVAMTVTDNERK